MPNNTSGIMFIYSLIVALLFGVISTIFSLTSARVLRRKLKEKGEEPLVDLDFLSTTNILVILLYTSKFLERKYPAGYIAYHNWRVIKACAKTYDTVLAWVLQIIGIMMLLLLLASIITS